MRTRHFILGALLFLSASIFNVTKAQTKLDFTKTEGVIKPVNGVGQPPFRGFSDVSLFHYLQEAGIPYSRLHDMGGSYGENIFVDIPNLFRDFDADENDPASYDFTFTDILMKGLVDYGVEPYFRLGVSIENGAAIKAYRIYPPKDFAKWARICDHVIMHYNDGWAEGFHMGVTHWEIWNEPENGETPETNQMWLGTWDEYMDLYGTTATYLKQRHPELKIGGYGSCGFYAVNGEGVMAANTNARFAYFIECFHKFLSRAQKEGWPLDFFSAHSYADPATAVQQMQYARKTLDEYGFTSTELSVNEWLPSPTIEKLGTSLQAAEIAAEMIGFQNSRVDDAEIYDARARGGTYSPLFQPESDEPRLAYYSYFMFNELRKLGKAVKLPEVPNGISICAASADGKAALMVSNISTEAWKPGFDFCGYKVSSVHAIDQENGYHEMKKAPKKISPASVLLITLVAE